VYYEHGYRPDVAGTLLAMVALHVNAVPTRTRMTIGTIDGIGVSSKWVDLCTSNRKVSG